VSILQKSRTWLHTIFLRRNDDEEAVSILQKSRTWLHLLGGTPSSKCKLRVNPSEIKDLVTQQFLVLVTFTLICVNPSEIKDLVTRPDRGADAGTPSGVNPSEIKDLVTLKIHSLRPAATAVSILQKSRTWLHQVRARFREPAQPVSILQKSRTWLHAPPPPTSRCPTSSVNPSEIKDLVTPSDREHEAAQDAVSILQKSRTWLHLDCGIRDAG